MRSYGLFTRMPGEKSTEYNELANEMAVEFQQTFDKFEQDLERFREELATNLKAIIDRDPSGRTGVYDTEPRDEIYREIDRIVLKKMNPQRVIDKIL